MCTKLYLLFILTFLNSGYRKRSFLNNLLVYLLVSVHLITNTVSNLLQNVLDCALAPRCCINGLFCHDDATCVGAFLKNPYCLCDEGYKGDGFQCTPEEHCEGNQIWDQENKICVDPCQLESSNCVICTFYNSNEPQPCYCGSGQVCGKEGCEPVDVCRDGLPDGAEACNYSESQQCHSLLDEFICTCNEDFESERSSPPNQSVRSLLGAPPTQNSTVSVIPYNLTEDETNTLWEINNLISTARAESRPLSSFPEAHELQKKYDQLEKRLKLASRQDVTRQKGEAYLAKASTSAKKPEKESTTDVPTDRVNDINTSTYGPTSVGDSVTIIKNPVIRAQAQEYELCSTFKHRIYTRSQNDNIGCQLKIKNNNKDNQSQHKRKLGIMDYACKDGFHYSEEFERCKDINECEDNLSICEEGKECKNIEGSYSCNCFVGFYEDEHGQCFDINECETLNSAQCDGHCMNTRGSYYCGCQEGFTTTSSNCQAIEECPQSNPCSQNCVNYENMFTCTCINNTTPIISSACYSKYYTNNPVKNCAENSFYDDHSGECICKNGYNKVYDYKPYTFLDVNNCQYEKMGFKCKDFFKTCCFNEYGNYQCQIKE